MHADKKPSKSTKIQGGGERGEEKSKAHKASTGGIARTRGTMGHGKSSKQNQAVGAMGKHKSTGDGGASKS